MKYVGIGCVVLASLSCVGFGVLMLIGVAATSGLQDAAVACDGHPVPGARGASGTPRALLAFSRAEGAWIYAGNELPVSTPSASSADDATLVVCFEPEVLTELEQCTYDSGAIARRRAPTRTVRVVDPATGATVREMNLTGDAPAACPEVLLHLGEFHYDGTSPGEAELVTAFGDLLR